MGAAVRSMGFRAVGVPARGAPPNKGQSLGSSVRHMAKGQVVGYRHAAPGSKS